MKKTSLHIKIKIKLFVFASLLLLFFLLQGIISSTSSVETNYSTGVFVGISRLFRFLFGWIPCSIGDILYGCVLIYLLYSFFRITYRFVKWIGFLFSHTREQKSPLHLTSGAASALIQKSSKENKDLVGSPPKFSANDGSASAQRWLRVLSFINRSLFLYLLFLFLWGINYHRSGIAHQLSLPLYKYNSHDLETLNRFLVEKVNATRAYLTDHQTQLSHKDSIFQMAIRSYQVLAKEAPYMAYRPPSVKASLWGWAGNYLGFTGYYNPFTGEAQVNTTTPAFVQPFITCHEIAHQLGYASESEANFVGYLAATHSTDRALLYSAYLDIFLYANRNYYTYDSAAAVSFRNQLSKEVKADLLALKKFNQQHTSFLAPIFSATFDLFLKSQRQRKGVLSYNEVVGLVIAYEKVKLKKPVPIYRDKK